MTGRICLWRHRAAGGEDAGFHLSADRGGCDQLLVLLASLAKARSSQIGNIVLDPVTPAVLAVPGVQESAIIVYHHWELIADPRFPPERLHFSEARARLRTEMSAVQLESIVAAVHDVRERRAGYPIGDGGDDQLWFWWQGGD